MRRREAWRLGQWVAPLAAISVWVVAACSDSRGAADDISATATVTDAGNDNGSGNAGLGSAPAASGGERSSGGGGVSGSGGFGTARGGTSDIGGTANTGGSANTGGTANTGGSANTGGGAEFGELVTHYTELTRVTEKPIMFVDYGLCRIPIRGLDTPAHTAYGQLHVYVNELAAAPLAEAGSRTFPAGSVIVKEKLEMGDSGGLETKGLGMMRKDSEGWTYAYFEQEQLFEGVPELDYCAQCHETGMIPEGLVDFLGVGDVSQLPYQRPRDSVFLTLPEPPP